MKKVLLGSTALVAAGVLAGAATPARAAEPIQLSLGGYYDAFLAIRAQSDVDNAGPGVGESRVGNDEEIRHFDVQQEGEVWFVGETTLDNGIRVGVNIQLEAYTTGDQIDEHYVFFSGNFGRINFGAENAAPYLQHIGAPSPVVGHSLDSPNIWTMVGTSGNDANGAPPGSPLTTPVNITSDANKITYFTPRFSGFEFGFSYTPDTTDGNGRSGSPVLKSDTNDVGQENVIEVGVNFARSFGSVDFAWSFGYGHGFVEGDGTAGVACRPNDAVDARGTPVCIVDPDNQQGRDVLATGFNVGIGGWTVGGAFRWDDQGMEGDNREWAAVGGVTYGAGPWLVGGMIGYTEDEDGGGANDTDSIISAMLGGTYTLGPGVRVAGGIEAWRGEGDDGNENFDGIAFTMGTRLSF